MTTESNAAAWTVGKIMLWSTDYLRDRGLSDSPRLDAELLLSHALGCTRIQLYTSFDKPLTSDEREPFRDFLKRRSAGEPVAYITGVKEFMGHGFLVSPAVLIPRPDTEVLVESILDATEGRSPEELSVLDIGTGSGCIAVSLALKLKGAQVTAWDLDPNALALARTNAERLGATSLRFAQVDALDETAWDVSETFDFIASNPPYIAPDEQRNLPRSVSAFEPTAALFAAPDGLAFYRIFARRAAQLLKPDGHLYCEIGATQGDAVRSLLVAAGWRDVTVSKDYARLDRVVKARRPDAGALG